MCVGRCRMHVLLFVRWWWIRSSLFFLSHPGRGPAQSAERVWPKRGSETEGRSLSASKRGRREWLAASERRPRKKGFSLGKQSLSRRARVSKRANEGGTVLDLPGATLNLSVPSLHLLAVREAACMSSLPFWAVGEAACTSSRRSTLMRR